MFIRDEIAKRATEFIFLCLTHKVKDLYAFGSSVNERFNAQKSDIDLLVDINAPDPLERGELLISLWDGFETFFNRKVDLLTESSLRNPYLRKNIENTKVLIYDGTDLKVFV